ncbi:hypothetical protein A5759_15725 [Mycobacterium sp. 852014-52144_SCH5372336]|nr:hypothetical protein A5759_15725 [Mycobacterium sp. 852014-52144_SCH5372336]
MLFAFAPHRMRRSLVVSSATLPKSGGPNRDAAEETDGRGHTSVTRWIDIIDAYRPAVGQAPVPSGHVNTECGT